MGALKLETTEDARQVLLELQRRVLERPNLVDDKFPKQAAFLRDRTRFKSMLCTRRAGKSNGLGRWLLAPLIEKANVTSIYAALTRDSAKKIMWRDVILALNDELKLCGEPNKSELSMTFPNGSVIYLTGIDQGPQEMKKLLGQKPVRVGIDECGEMRQDLREIVYSVLRPALIDYRGELTLAGTPGDVPSGLFYDATAGTLPEWGVHSWSALENPYVSENFQKELDDLTKENPRIVETPWFKRMMLGIWVKDTSKLVYKYNRDRNYVVSRPDLSYTYVLGCDIGYDNPTSFVVAAYSPGSPDLFFLEPFKKSAMLVSEIAERIRYYMNRFPLARIVIDPANKTVVEDLKQRFSLPLTSAEKPGKHEFIEILNSEMILGNIKLVGEECHAIEDEWTNLIWSGEGKDKEEHPSCPNDLADACLYAWRYCYQFLYKPKAKPPVKTDEEKVEQWFEEEASKILNKKSEPFWKRRA